MGFGATLKVGGHIMRVKRGGGCIANIMNVFIFVFCILFVNIDKTVLCVSVKSIKSLSLS